MVEYSRSIVSLRNTRELLREDLSILAFDYTVNFPTANRRTSFNVDRVCIEHICSTAKSRTRLFADAGCAKRSN